MSELLTPTNQERQRHLFDGLDYYKLTMGQFALAHHGDTEVTFTMKNRSAEFPLSEHIDTAQLSARFAEIQAQGVTQEELDYLSTLKDSSGNPRFSEAYSSFLKTLRLSDVHISQDEATNDIAISATGPWPNVSLLETVVMSEVNEQYYTNTLMAEGVSLADVWEEGDRRLSKKIARLQERPDILISDFGTRRRFSADWHAHVVARLKSELPESFIGTSNPWLAHTYNLTPIGTYAHELPMVFAALADRRDAQPLDGHREMMEAWYEMYGQDLSIGLTDTFTSDFFFSDITEKQAAEWRGLRHDSGDPIAFGEAALAFYEARGISPTEKTLVFSDGLDLDTIITIADHFKGRVQLLFGWGTTLMNDLGYRANNIVMKATSVDGMPTVKLSDVSGKHTGPEDQVARYTALAQARVGLHRVFENMERAS